jgi:hypothetical protein
MTPSVIGIRVGVQMKLKMATVNCEEQNDEAIFRGSPDFT